jgi:hypothetical protein
LEKFLKKIKRDLLAKGHQHTNGFMLYPDTQDTQEPFLSVTVTTLDPGRRQAAMLTIHGANVYTLTYLPQETPGPKATLVMIQEPFVYNDND